MYERPGDIPERRDCPPTCWDTSPIPRVLTPIPSLLSLGCWYSKEYSETIEGTQQVKDFVKWCLTTGQDYSEAAATPASPHVIRAGLTKKLDSVGT